MNIFIFHRSLRLPDNIGLIESCKNGLTIPIFIFNPKQIIYNKYKSSNSIQFMIECLEELNMTLKKNNSKLHIFFGDYIKILKYIINLLDISGIYINKDYSPFAIKRNNNIKKLCKMNNISFHDYHDCLLYNMNSNKDNGSPYLKFSPFYNKYKYVKPNIPTYNSYKNLIKYNFKNEVGLNYINKYYIYNEKIHLHGGRSKALSILNKFNYNKYNKYNNTTKLSAYIKFGCVSIREVYYKFNTQLRKQLFWREFYTILEYYYGLDALRNSKKKWVYDNKYLKKWKNGKTGIPIIDAGMIELNTTGYIHNRIRLIVADFLIKKLNIHWKVGERYFARKLIDYDIGVNNGNWQWVAGIGTDYRPRYFNPWIQSKKYDKNCDYIKKHIPELKNIPPKHIHKWYDKYMLYDVYLKPIEV